MCIDTLTSAILFLGIEDIPAARDWLVSSPKFVCWHSHPLSDVTWRWGVCEISMFRWAHEGRALPREDTSKLARSPHHVKTQQGDGQQSASQEESSPQNPMMLTLWSSLWPSRNVRKHFCLNNPVCAMLLWKPKVEHLLKYKMPSVQLFTAGLFVVVNLRNTQVSSKGVQQ